jgi:lipoprotein NlpD
MNPRIRILSWRWCRWLCVLLSLSACAVRAPPPEKMVVAPSLPTEHIVQPNDSLYRIARLHGFSWQELAQLNGLASPYRIFPGQVIRLPTASPSRSGRPASGTAARPPASTPPASTPPARPPIRAPSSASAPPARPPATSPPTRAPSSASAPPARPAAASTPGTGTRPAAPATVPTAPAAATTRAAPAPSLAPSSAAPQWQWPAEGAILRGFSSSSLQRRGIAIGGRLGDPVRAAAAGEVVYSGSGLVGYGRLIILKHSAGFISAYGHNDALLVREGDTVRVGQTIARMGASGTDLPMLHFEIRVDGAPVDPMRYLPRR